jgi:predicted small metal-binding protein
MAKQINCECGYTVRGETEDEVLGNAEEHIQRDHPELVGSMSRDDLRGMVEEA